MPILQKLRTLVSRASATEDSPAAPTHFGFILGTRVQLPKDFDAEPIEEQVVYTPATDGHLLLTGGPGTGKTLLLGALADEAANDMEVHTVDTWGTLNKSHALQPKAAATIGFTFSECATTLEIVLAEVRRRVQHCELEGVAAFSELQDPPRRILVILDDTRHLLTGEYFSESHLHRDDIARSVECTEEIVESSERAGVTFVFTSSWKEDESGLPARILEGHLSRLDLKTRFNDFGNDRGYRVREGYWQPSGQAELLLTMQERKDDRPLLGPAKPRGHVAAPGCC